MVLLFALLAVLAWEVVRTNMSDAAKGHLPWKIATLGISPAASLAGVFGGLLLARSQFARSIRPAIGWAGEWENAQQDEGLAGASNISTWTVKVYNGGSGLGVVHECLYQVAAKRATTAPGEWVTLSDARDKLEDAGLVPYVSFTEVGVGHPLVSSTKPKDGYPIFRLQHCALDDVVEINMRIAVVDMVGDRHQRYMQLLKGAGEEWPQSEAALSAGKHSAHAAHPAAQPGATGQAGAQP